MDEASAELPRDEPGVACADLMRFMWWFLKMGGLLSLLTINAYQMVNIC